MAEGQDLAARVSPEDLRNIERMLGVAGTRWEKVSAVLQEGLDRYLPGVRVRIGYMASPSSSISVSFTSENAEAGLRAASRLDSYFNQELGLVSRLILVRPE